MKMVFGILLSGVMSLSVSAGYDYIIDDGYTPGITLQGNQSLFMTGGGLGDLTLYDCTTATIQNTSALNQFIGGIWQIRLSGDSTINIAGGQIHELDINYSSLAQISGGQIESIYSYQSAWKTEGQPPVLVPNPHIEMFVRDWNFDELTKQLTGTWGDFSTFNIKLIDVQGYSPTIENIKFTIIPEPISLMLLALGGMMMRRRA